MLDEEKRGLAARIFQLVQLFKKWKRVARDCIRQFKDNETRNGRGHAGDDKK
jgi:hypothetical protein